MTAKSSELEIRTTPPRVIPDFAERRELLQRLDDSGDQLIYVVAPSGFGKSVLASQWMERVADRDGIGVWIDIDPFESELEFMVTAFTAFRREMKSFAQWFDPQEVADIDSALEALETMIDELARFKREIRLVIDSADNFGVSKNAIAHRFITRLPKNVKIMVVRERSPIASTLGTAGMNNFTVVTADDLRLGPKEVLEMMQGKSNQRHAEMIVELTNGWPSAIRIVMENLNKFDFNGQTQVISNLGSLASITRQAIARLDERELQILRSLVLVDRISNQVATVITGDELAPMILAKLSAESFFLTRVISTPTVYEMNQLIRDALREDFALDPVLFSELHSRTFDTLYKFGAKDQAFVLLARAGNEEMIKKLISDSDVMSEINMQVRDAIYRGELSKLRSWSTLLPFLEGEKRSLSFSLDFYVQLIAGDLDRAKALLTERNIAYLQKPDGEFVKNSSLRLQAIVDFVRGEFTSSKESALSAMREMKPDEELNRLSSISSFLRFGASAALITEDHNAMKEIEEFVDTRLSPDPSSHYHMNILVIKTIRAFYEGRYRLAESFAFAAISYAKQHSISGLFLPFEAYYALCQILTEQCRFEEAEDLYREAITEARRVKNIPWMMMLQGKHASSLMLDGRIHDGLADFQEMTEHIPAMRTPEIEEMKDRLEMVVQHLADSQIRREQIRSRLPENQTSRLYGALTHLRKNPKEFEKSISKFDLSLPREAISANIFKVFQNFEYPPVAREHLIKALEIAQEHGFYRHLLVQGDQFLAFLISTSTEVPSLFLERLAKDASERLRNKLTSSDSLPVPLTKREADILRHLASEQPLSKIAGNLNITKNTMKTHLRHLYRKLGATDRRDAVEKGKALLSL